MKKSRVHNLFSPDQSDSEQWYTSNYDPHNKELLFSRFLVNAGIESSNWSLSSGDIDLLVSCLIPKGGKNPAEGWIDAGMTYLGQMVTHDLVPATIHSDNSRDVTPSLDLKSVYPERMVGQRYFDETGRFHLGCSHCGTDPKTCLTCLEDDLNRDLDELAIIPEQRNDENIIIAQLHLQWQKLHNQAITLVEQLEPGANRERKIKYAQTYVTLIFQKVIIDDYLKAILDFKVYDLVIKKKKSYLYTPKSGQKFDIPLEFSKAVFRFGHSMIRATYDLNTKPAGADVHIASLVYEGPIKQEHIIEWRKFFDLRKNNQDKETGLPQTAADLRPNLVSVLGKKSTHLHVRSELKSFLKDKESINLPNEKINDADNRSVDDRAVDKKLNGLIKKDILASINLPTGADLLNALWVANDDPFLDVSGVYDELDIPPPDELIKQINEEVLISFPECGQYGWLTVENCPLWVFILAEAYWFDIGSIKIRNSMPTRGRGMLGAVASLIIGEVVRQAILQAETNIYQPYEQLAKKLGPLSHKYNELLLNNPRITMKNVIEQPL